ncbi:class I SAM-dependent methyltransferase [Oceanirhabdus seepicola]|uniref:Class I SAM-dependent methyltransferase n=1 Tax=Oceanirhabdus seepicola TaxID=2828781 RepID=A0A9J6NXN8_9CLOT|nr:class I SAM-dependent methyltransferase [Oceanirhabdus seepicola]MCM1989271.1 class I SAM-dependent methyltransferase [Oceanirhabdus seepicola]
MKNSKIINKYNDEVLTEKYCPLCENDVSSFLPFGLKKRLNAQCPRCFSLERHRLIWLYIKERTNLLTEQSRKIQMLHIAPEAILRKKFSQLSNIEYLSADLNPKKAMVKMDIQAIQYPDNSFDVIYGSHVLEHIPDDKKAMRELYRVLKNGGWAILPVPIRYSKYETFEDPKINTPELRLKYYGQSDHLRYYGLDYKDRLESAGFNVRVDKYSDKFDEETKNKYGLPNKEYIYYCTKDEQKTK